MKTIDTEGTPSDTDLEKRIRTFLDQRKVASLRRVAVSVDNGTVRLCGRLRSFYEKQLCLNCCRRVAGVTRVVDEISVESKSDAPFH